MVCANAVFLRYLQGSGRICCDRAALDTPDIQYHIAHASFENPAKRVFDKFPGLTFGACQLRPHSTGYIHITSGDPFAHPTIQPNYLDAEIDQQVLIASMRIARDIMSSDVMRDEVVRDQSLPRYPK